MKAYRTLMMVALVGAAMSLPAIAGNGGPGKGPGGGVVSPLDRTEAATLTFMREEEKLARDVYLTLNETYRSRVLANIARSEQQHMNALLKLLTKYGLADPVLPAPGSFTDGNLAILYGELVAQGRASYSEAMLVGACIEEIDIADLEDAIDASTKADVKRVYTNLLLGSRNHLRAFIAEYERLGNVYVPQCVPTTP
jgi:hypothetical protein